MLNGFYIIILTGFVGPDHCTITCTHQHGDYRDFEDGPSDRLPVDTIFQCLTYEGDSYYAWFGYENQNLHNVYISLGADNVVTGIGPETVAEGQPERFRPGLHEYAMKLG